MLGFRGTLYCDRCKRSIADLDEDEVKAYGSEAGVIELCFDCDPESAATVPSLFWQWHPGDVFILDDKALEVVSGSGVPEFLIDITHTRMSARTRDCLSSSTYLNTSPNQDGDGKPDTANDAEYFGNSWEGIILPAWVVNQPPVGKTYGHGRAGCPDCDTVRSLGGVGYCSYHHALLIEQYEDGSLGYGNG